MKKHNHRLIVNKISKDNVRYTYNFGSTKDIELILSETGFSITADLTKIYDSNEMLSGNSYLFPDGIKKALLLYLIKYSKSLKIKNITIQIDNDEEILNFNDETIPPVYSMINGNLFRNMPVEFSDKAVFEHLLNTPKSKYDKRIVSLFAFLFSKNKEYETERFIYLWTAFNGMYGWLWEFIYEVQNYKDSREYKQILGILKYLELGEETIEKNKEKFRLTNEAIAILKEMDVSLANRNYIETSIIGTKITQILNSPNNQNKNYNITAYGYLITQLSYYFRCKIVHGDKPIFLFAYSDDRELHALQIINALLEEVIENNLPKWFDNDYVQNVIIPKTQNIEIPK